MDVTTGQLGAQLDDILVDRDCQGLHKVLSCSVWKKLFGVTKSKAYILLFTFLCAVNKQTSLLVTITGSAKVPVFHLWPPLAGGQHDQGLSPGGVTHHLTAAIALFPQASVDLPDFCSEYSFTLLLHGAPGTR